ncbi:MAG: PAS domain-containing sensor histidine kinase [Planctomycetia bacterium]|nr:PAS domain-containing sensor histidine kinase [Planctomycetia bacterium]
MRTNLTSTPTRRSPQQGAAPDSPAAGESVPSLDTALQERVKELTCLYAIAQISGKPTASLPDVLQGVVDILPTAWQFPHLASARITLDGTQFNSKTRLRSGPRQKASLVVRGFSRGTVQLGYAPSAKSGRGSPFLDEERRLLDEVARQVSLIVDRKETAAEQERLHAKLRHADRLATIGQLAAGVAHELNEPLGGILGFAQLLAKTPRLPPQARADIAKIEASALHAREVIRQLMTFARQTPPRDVRVNVNRLIKESAGIWLPRCEAGGVHIAYALDDSIPEIVADDGQLRQVVTNLVVNAVQAMSEGGTLRIETMRDGDWVQLAVCDTGGGIPPNVLPRIFDPFFTTKDVDEGTGLGLSVVHGIVTGHEGKIAVESASDRGTRVTVRLPINRPPDLPTKPGGSHAQA